MQRALRKLFESTLIEYRIAINVGERAEHSYQHRKFDNAPQTISNIRILFLNEHLKDILK